MPRCSCWVVAIFCLWTDSRNYFTVLLWSRRSGWPWETYVVVFGRIICTGNEVNKGATAVSIPSTYRFRPVPVVLNVMLFEVSFWDKTRANAAWITVESLILLLGSLGRSWRTENRSVWNAVYPSLGDLSRAIGRADFILDFQKDTDSEIFSPVCLIMVLNGEFVGIASPK